jgi:hypothetical protein
MNDMNVIEELIERGLVPRDAFIREPCGVWEEMRAELADPNSDLSREVDAALRRQAINYSAVALMPVGD